MLEVTGDSVPEIIENIAIQATRDAGLRLRERITKMLADTLQIDRGKVSRNLVLALAQPSGKRQDEQLSDYLQMSIGATLNRDDNYFESISNHIVMSAKIERLAFMQKRNQASYVKSVMRPLHDVWLKRWHSERQNFPLSRASLRSQELKYSRIVNSNELSNWAEEVLKLFRDTAVEVDRPRDEPRARGTVSEVGFRAYKTAWINFISEYQEIILKQLREPSIVNAGGDNSRRPSQEFLTTKLSYSRAGDNHSLNQSLSAGEDSLPNRRIEICLESKDSNTAKVTRTWENPQSEITTEFKNWIDKLAPLLCLTTTGFSGNISITAPWGNQEVRLKHATKEQLVEWGGIMLSP